MDMGIMWIFVAAIVIVFALAFATDFRGQRAAKKYRADYERSLKIQEDMLELLRELVALQRETVRRLEAIQQSTEVAGRSEHK
jgi:hypothetical protein